MNYVSLEMFKQSITTWQESDREEITNSLDFWTCKILFKPMISDSLNIDVYRNLISSQQSWILFNSFCQISPLCKYPSQPFLESTDTYWDKIWGKNFLPNSSRKKILTIHTSHMVYEKRLSSSFMRIPLKG